MSSYPLSYQWRRVLLTAGLAMVTAFTSAALAASETEEGKSSQKATSEEHGTKSEKTEQSGKSGKNESSNASENSKYSKNSKAKETKPSAKGDFTAEAIIKVIESAGDPDLNYRVSAVVDGNNVLVQTWVNPKSSKTNRADFERDHKIDAVMITKNLMDSFPKASFGECKVRYFDRDERTKYTEIVVVPGVVTSFASGILKEDGLIKTLPLTTGDTAPPAVASVPTSVTPPEGAVPPAVVPISGRTLKAVLPGYKYEERGRALKQILKLESMRVGTGTVRESLATIEELVRDKDKTGRADEKLSTLEVDLAQMEDNANKVKAAGAAKAVATKKAAPSGSVGSTPPGSVPLPAGVKPDDGNARHYQDMRSVFGEFWPHFGPMWPDRNRIAQILMSYSKMLPQLARIPKIKEALKSNAGQVSVEDLKLVQSEPLMRNLTNLTTQFHQMEALVTNGSSGVDPAVKQMNTAMGLKDMPRDERYKMQENENKDWIAGGYK